MTLDTQRWLLKLLGSDFRKRPVLTSLHRNCSTSLKSANGGVDWKRPSNFERSRDRFFAMPQRRRAPSVIQLSSSRGR